MTKLGKATAVLLPLLLVGCANPETGRFGVELPNFMQPPPSDLPPVIRQPVVPEMLKRCRGEVLVDALGLKFVRRNGTVPGTGRYMREESLTPPYRIVTPNAYLSKDMNIERLNVEIDNADRIVGLYCG